MSQQTQRSSQLENKAVVHSPVATRSYSKPTQSNSPKNPIALSILQYGSAFVFTLVAFMLRLALQPLTGTPIPFITFFPAVLLCSVYSGWRAGLLCITLSALASTYFLYPVGSFHIHNSKDWTNLAIFISISTMIVLLAESQRKARIRAETHAEEAQRNQAQVQALQQELNSRLQEAEQQARLLETVLDNIPTGITIADPPDVRIRKGSRYGVQISGVESGEIEGKLQSDVMWSTYRTDGITPAKEEELPLTRATLQGEVVRGEEWLLLNPMTGEFVHLLCNASPVRDEAGNILCGILVWSDISNLVAAQNEIARLNERLHRAVYESSHRIKNQLQVLSATTDMILMNNPEVVSSTELRRLNSQIAAIAITHDLLTYEARADGTNDQVSIKALLERFITTLQQTTVKHSIAYTLANALVPIKTGTTLALLTNEAISNAIKHGGKNVTVTLKVNAGEGKLEIGDDGPGFPVNFDPYLAANTGLELLLALTQTDLKGKIEFNNRADGGASVCMQFPLSGEVL